MKCNGSCAVLSRPLQDPTNDNWKIIIFSVEESGQLPLIQVNKINISCAGTNCYQLPACRTHRHCWDSFAKKKTVNENINT